MRSPILIFLLILVSSLHSETFVYLSKNGNDNNNGSIGYPVLTIGKAIELAANTHSIRATDGTFTTAQANLQTSLYGGYNTAFTYRSDTLITQIIGTGGWGDPKPTLYVANESNLVIDQVTVKASESGTKRPVAIYFYYCDNTVSLQNSKAYGQATSNAAQGTEAIYIYQGAPKILNSYVYGGNLQKDINAVSGIRAKYFTGEISGCEVYAGSNYGCCHGIWTERSACEITYNYVHGGNTGSSCYSCGIRAGDTAETWNSSGSDDLIQNNQVYGGTGYRTYDILCSQESNQTIKNNLLGGGSGSVVAMNIYIKTNDSPRIENNTFENADYGIYEWNFGDYSPDDNNPQMVRFNYFKSTLDIPYHVFWESDNSEQNVYNICTEVATDSDGVDVLKAWLNTCQSCFDSCATDTTVPPPDTTYALFALIQAESDTADGWLITTKNDSACVRSSILQCSANSAYKLEYTFEVPPGINLAYLFAEYDVNEFSDSFFIQVNNTTVEWKGIYFSGTGWQRGLIGSFNVFEGTNYLRLFPREKGCFLNWFIFSSDANFDIENF